MDGWDSSDLPWEISYLYCEEEGLDNDEDEDIFEEKQNNYEKWLLQNGILRQFNDCLEYAYIGPKDLDLAHRMIKAGVSDSKFLRQINVSVDITAPLYWWKEFDTYKIGTVANSTSTMHKLATTPITLNCFEITDYNSDLPVDKIDQSNVVDSDFIDHWHIDIFSEKLIEQLEDLRQMYIKTKDKRYWKELVRWLPNGWLQTRTITMNYAVLRNIYFQRQHHKLSEWHQFCDWVESLPYADDLIIYTKEKDKNYIYYR